MTLSFERNPRTQGHEILSRKTKDLEVAHSKDFVILGVAVLIQCQGVTDGQTPRPWLRRAKHSAIARKNHYKSATCLRSVVQNSERSRNDFRAVLKKLADSVARIYLPPESDSRSLRRGNDCSALTGSGSSLSDSSSPGDADVHPAVPAAAADAAVLSAVFGRAAAVSPLHGGWLLCTSSRQRRVLSVQLGMQSTGQQQRPESNFTDAAMATHVQDVAATSRLAMQPTDCVTVSAPHFADLNAPIDDLCTWQASAGEERN